MNLEHKPHLLKKLKLTPVEFYQFKVQYNTITLNEKMNTQEDLEKAAGEQTKYNSVIKTQDFELDVKDYVAEKEKGNVNASYNRWLYEITKESFGYITAEMLNEQAETLKAVFEKATYIINGKCYFSSLINQAAVKENARKGFYEKRTFETAEEIIPQSANLLKVVNFSSTVSTTTPNKYYPGQSTVEKVISADNGKIKLDKKTEKTIALLEETGYQEMANKIREENTANPDWYKAYHYISYKTDSGFEQTFLQEILKVHDFKNNELEVYYNGDRALTEFKIKCFKGSKGKWKYLEIYTPDFLLIKRKDSKIYKIIIIETKGQAYATDKDFIAKKDFMQTEFIKQNNDKFGYSRFDYLYIEDSDSQDIRIIKTADKIKEFFGEEN